ncbi:MAG: hypothetical protein HYX90_10505 [Chloroflexi bacterium]|nr:hypothetical protein [Chloroflexota bacterium]
MVKLEVLDPCGSTGAITPHAPRLPDLNGKTICEVSNGRWEDYRTFPLIRDRLLRQFPGARIVPYTEFPIGSDQIDTEEIGQLVKRKGCQAAIVGNAG